MPLAGAGEVNIKSDHVLIRTGPYRWIRHPIYTAFLGVFLGSSLVSYRGLGLVGLAIACCAYLRKIRIEERYLQSAFGPEYEAYRRRTGAL